MTALQSIKYTTRQGDTFDELALQVYDSEKRAHLLIEANPDYADVLTFDAGTVLTIPVNDDIVLPETLAPWRRGS